MFIVEKHLRAVVKRYPGEHGVEKDYITPIVEKQLHRVEI
jgi:hypothetical protein